MDPSTARVAARPDAPPRQASLGLTLFSESENPSYRAGDAPVKTRSRLQLAPDPVEDETPLTLADVLLWPEWTAVDVTLPGSINYAAFGDDGYPLNGEDA